MATLRVNIIRPNEQDSSVPVASDAVFVDQMVGVQMTGTLKALLHRVEEIIAMGPGPEWISMDLVLELRAPAAQLTPGPTTHESFDCIGVPSPQALVTQA